MKLAENACITIVLLLTMVESYEYSQFGAIREFSPIQAVSGASSGFALNLYQDLSAQPGNIFFSPLSIQIALVLVYLGAKGNTAFEIARGLHLRDNKQVIGAAFSEVMRQLNGYDEVSLQIANEVFLKRGFKIKNEFKHAATAFNSGAEELDFNRPEESRAQINGWIEAKTQRKIKNLIKPGVLSSFTRMVIANAVYFKGEWVKQFEKTSTSPMLFHSERATNVEMMFVKDRFKYTYLPQLDSQVLLLPYRGERFSMMVLLPKRVNGLFAAERRIGGIDLFDVADHTYWQTVHVYLPKFKMEYERELEEILPGHGMVDMFDIRKANFTGISDAPLVVSNVIHKAFIEVNEEGTEAAAATVAEIAVLSTAVSPPPQSILFRADRPFAFFILDLETRMVLFAGRLSSPDV
ncbi:serpin B6-like [Schistocerca nitens]|uniref:serpin B6-like n=1 Tax=Schistocerca nitens TaxID=7011 RepID=UPI002118A7D2|nr:serpin B6-like [Schistocerca nitens]